MKYFNRCNQVALSEYLSYIFGILVTNKVEGMWEEMVAYLSVPYSYLKGVQKTAEPAVW